jgi:hypothetical protein
MATDRFGSPIIEDRKVDRFGSPLFEEVPTPSSKQSDQTFEAKPSDEPDFGKVLESGAYGFTTGLVMPEILQKVVSPARKVQCNLERRLAFQRRFSTD